MYVLQIVNIGDIEVKYSLFAEFSEENVSKIW
jgi:hypothetical protein